MGYRAVAITEMSGLVVPQWFKDKWDDQLNISQFSEFTSEDYRGKPSTPISYKWERKWHDDIIEDLQKVVAENVDWQKYGFPFRMIMMHEDGKVNRLNIYHNHINIEEPTGWEEADDVHQF